MKRAVALLLCASLCLLPARAVETGFSDVQEGDWFAPYVTVCVQDGLLQGVGEGRFDPQGQVSMGQVIVMAARVLWQANGGSGALPRGGSAEELTWSCLGEGAEEFYDALLAGFSPYVGSYAWDGLYYLYTCAHEMRGGLDLPDFHFCDPGDPATRQAFFATLAFAAQDLELEELNEVDAIPDLRGGGVGRLYAAGILSGVDEYGTFAAEQFLTRSEAAAALARLARPELRLRFTLTPAPMPEALAELGTAVTRLGGGFGGRVNLEYGVCFQEDAVTDLEGNVILDFSALGYRLNGGYHDQYGLACLYRKDEMEKDPWDRQQGVVFSNGALLFPYEDITPLDDNSLLVHIQGEEYGIYDLQGNLLTSLSGYETLSDGGEGLLLHHPAEEDRNPQWDYLDREGNVVLSVAYEKAEPFSQGLAPVGEAEPLLFSPRPVHWGYMDREGTLVVPCQFEEVRPFREGLAAVEDDTGRWGYIDREGNVVIPCQFDYAYSFCNGLALVMMYERDGSYHSGFIDREGNWVAPPVYDDLEPFSDGLAPFVRKEGTVKVFGYLSPDGTEHPFDLFDHVNRTPEMPLDFIGGYVRFYENKKWGLMDTSFQVILPAQFQWVEIASNGRVLVSYDNTYYLVELGDNR